MRVNKACTPAGIVLSLGAAAVTVAAMKLVPLAQRSLGRCRPPRLVAGIGRYRDLAVATWRGWFGEPGHKLPVTAQEEEE